MRVKADPTQSLRYGELIGDGLKLQVDEKIALKKNAEYKVIGKSIPRVDIPAKVTGEFTYIHDFRLPEMLHARVIRPDHYGARVASVDDSAARQVNGFVQTVRKGDFVAVVARNEWAAVKAARAIRVNWTAGTGLPDQATVFETWRQRPVAKEEVTQNVGDAKTALDGSAKRIKATYDFAVQTHATIGPSCAVADFQGGKLTVWTSSQATHSMQHELAVITGLSARSDPPGLHRRRRLLRPQRHRGRRCGCGADCDAHRQAGARAMVAGGRNGARAQESAANDGPGGGPRCARQRGRVDGRLLYRAQPYRRLQAARLPAARCGGNRDSAARQLGRLPVPKFGAALPVLEHPGEYASHCRGVFPLLALAQPRADREQLCQRGLHGRTRGGGER